MYWYEFEKDENQLAREQAASQITSRDGGGMEKKVVGNLGEIAFERFCAHFLPEAMWEWKNEAAFENRETEYNEIDFEIARTPVDVKSSVDLSSLQSLNWVMTRDVPEQYEIFVFIQITNNREKAALLGWTTNRDLMLSARIRQDGAKFPYFNLRELYELFGLLNVSFSN